MHLIFEGKNAVFLLTTTIEENCLVIYIHDAITQISIWKKNNF